MILKILVFGFILHPGSYLRNSWNVLDCIISVMGMMSAFGDGAFKFMKVLRVVRALRPLRVVRRHPNLRVAVLGLHWGGTGWEGWGGSGVERFGRFNSI